MKDKCQQNKHRWLWCLGLFAICSSNPLWAKVLDRTVAVVNGEPILLSEIDRTCKAALDDLPANLPLDEMSNRQREIRQQTLDGLVDDLLVRQQIRDHKIVVTDEEVDAEVKRVMEINKLSDQQLREALKLHENKTLDQFKEERRRDMEQQKLVDVQIRGNPELRGRLQVGEKEVEDAYKAQYQSVGSMEKVRASHILFMVPPNASTTEEAAVRQRAQGVLQQLRAGAAFEDLAKQFSEDPSSALGGDLGYFHRGDMVTEFDEVAFRIKKGEFSDLVRTQFGFHIVKVTDRATDGPKPMEEVGNEIRGRLQRERFQQVLRDWIAELRQHSSISVKL